VSKKLLHVQVDEFEKSTLRPAMLVLDYCRQIEFCDEDCEIAKKLKLFEYELECPVWRAVEILEGFYGLIAQKSKKLEEVSE